MDGIGIRRARPAETRLIGRMFQIASAGLADYNWARLALPGEAPLDVAERRFRRPGVEFCYENAWFAEDQGAVVGLVHAFGMPAEAPDPADLAAMDPVLRPLAELDVPGSFYIAALAVLPHAQGHGIGTRLMRFAEDLGCAQGYALATIGVYAANTGALRLYRRLGYAVVGRRPLVQHPPFLVEGDVLMLAKRLR